MESTVPVSFLVKKIAGTYFMPMPILIGITIVGAIIVWRSQKLKAFGWSVMLSGVMLLYLLSLPVLPAALHRSIISTYRTELPDSLAYVVVLDGGTHRNAALSPVNQINGSTLPRLMEGLRILRAYPDAFLIATGGRYGTDLSSASMIQSAAVSLGFAAERILLEERSRDTSDQADRIASMVGNAPIAVVSSVRHIPRVIMLFRQRGLEPTPVLSDFAYTRAPGISFASLVPNPRHLQESTHLWYEFLGRKWALLTGD